MKNTSHLVALQESVSRNRQWLAAAKNERERQHFQRRIEQMQREVDAEMRFLGMPLDSELEAMSDAELLAELEA